MAVDEIHGISLAILRWQTKPKQITPAKFQKITPIVAKKTIFNY
jgi:hypothetical protein